MKLVLTILIFFNLTFLLAQCPTGDLVLSSQADVDNFSINYPGCTQIQGDLKISGTDITNLNGLIGINEIHGLHIFDNPLLLTLEGLNGITVFNREVSLTGIRIENNSLLTNLEGLSNGVIINPIDLYVINNPQLTGLNGLQGLSGVLYTFELINNDSIVDLNGLNNVEIFDDFYIANNDSLTSFQGLDSFIFTGGFYIINNDALVSLTSLGAIDPLCGIIIEDNDVLEDIDGFVSEFSNECGPHLRIVNNPNLAVCNVDFVCSIIPYLDSTISIPAIENNAVGCNTISEISDACTLSNEEFNTNELKIYPNPTSDIIYLQSTLSHPIHKVELFTVRGQKVSTLNTNWIDLSGFESGIYLLKVYVNDRVLIKRIVNL